MVGLMKFDFAEFAQKCRSLKGASLLIMLIAGILNLAVGLYVPGIVFLALTILFAIRLSRQDTSARRR